MNNDDINKMFKENKELKIENVNLKNEMRRLEKKVKDIQDKLLERQNDIRILRKKLGAKGLGAYGKNNI